MNYDMEILKKQAKINALVALSQAATAELCGMNAENDARKRWGKVPAYHEERFFEIANTFSEIARELEKEGGKE